MNIQLLSDQTDKLAKRGIEDLKVKPGDRRTRAFSSLKKKNVSNAKKTPKQFSRGYV
jgi:hypothetical protein